MPARRLRDAPPAELRSGVRLAASLGGRWREGVCMDPSCYYAEQEVGGMRRAATYVPTAMALQAHRYGFGCLGSFVTRTVCDTINYF